MLSAIVHRYARQPLTAAAIAIAYGLSTPTSASPGQDANRSGGLPPPIPATADPSPQPVRCTTPMTKTALDRVCAELDLIASRESALEWRLADMEERMHAMEDKLKASAKARRTASHARMEAERGLAEAQQALGTHNGELRMLRDSNAALKTRIQVQRDAQESIERRLADSEGQLKNARGQLRSAASLGESRDRQIAELRDRQRRQGQECQQRVRTEQEKTAELQRTVTSLKAEVARLNGELKAARRKDSSARQQLEDSRARAELNRTRLFRRWTGETIRSDPEHKYRHGENQDG